MTTFALGDPPGTLEGLVPGPRRALSRAKAHGPGPWVRLMGPGPQALAHRLCPLARLMGPGTHGTKISNYGRNRHNYFAPKML
jgi:hypothetical protein